MSNTQTGLNASVGPLYFDLSTDGSRSQVDGWQGERALLNGGDNDLSDLNTTSKTNLVAAINEVNDPKVLAARRLVRSAARGIPAIGNVLGSPITPVSGTANANSTIIAGASVTGTGATYPILSTDSNSSVQYFDVVGGVLENNRINGPTQDSTGARRRGHGNGIRFGTYAQTFDIALNNTTTGKIIIYVTDTAGVRSRITADDFSPSANTHYLKVDFGSRALRIVEIYLDLFQSIFGINVPTTDSIWKVRARDVPHIAWVWDSYSANIMSAATGDATQNNPLKLSVIDYFGERIGVKDMFVSGMANTGMIADNAGAATTFGFRVANGDLNISRVGKLDYVIAPYSTNDFSASDAVLTAAATAYFLAIRAAQPDTTIVSFGPQYTNANQPSQARYDVCKAAFLAAIPDGIWLDNSPSGEKWLFGSSSAGINAVAIGQDTVHLSKVGSAYLGHRIGESFINGVRSKYGV